MTEKKFFYFPLFFQQLKISFLEKKLCQANTQSDSYQFLPVFPRQTIHNIYRESGIILMDFPLRIVLFLGFPVVKKSVFNDRSKTRIFHLFYLFFRWIFFRLFNGVFLRYWMWCRWKNFQMLVWQMIYLCRLV